MSPAKFIALMQKFVNVSVEESPVGSLVDADRPGAIALRPHDDQ